MISVGGKYDVVEIIADALEAGIEVPGCHLDIIHTAGEDPQWYVALPLPCEVRHQYSSPHGLYPLRRRHSNGRFRSTIPPTTVGHLVKLAREAKGKLLDASVYTD